MRMLAKWIHYKLQNCNYIFCAQRQHILFRISLKGGNLNAEIKGFQGPSNFSDKFQLQDHKTLASSLNIIPTDNINHEKSNLKENKQSTRIKKFVIKQPPSMTIYQP